MPIFKPASPEELKRREPAPKDKPKPKPKPEVKSDE